MSPAGYAFPPAMMANHSAEYPDGYLDKETLKSFFAISGDSGSFTYQPGYERIPGVSCSQDLMAVISLILPPDNWYKRPTADGYTIPR